MEAKQKIENEPRSLFRDERLQAVFLYLLLISVRSASLMSYLLPARYFHPCCSLGLTLFEYLSLCFRVGSLGNKMQIPVSFGILTALHSLMRSPVQYVACKMTAVLNFNIKVYARSL